MLGGDVKKQQLGVLGHSPPNEMAIFPEMRWLLPIATGRKRKKQQQQQQRNITTLGDTACPTLILTFTEETETEAMPMGLNSLWSISDWDKECLPTILGQLPCTEELINTPGFQQTPLVSLLLSSQEKGNIGAIYGGVIQGQGNTPTTFLKANQPLLCLKPFQKGNL